MDVTPRELRDVEIREAFRGYSRDEVNDLLERAAAAIETLTERLRVLGERAANPPAESAASAGGRGETEELLHRTLLLAQRASDEAIAEAEEKARVMVEEAMARSRAMVADAAIEARRSTESERRRLEQEIKELQSRRDALSTDVVGLEHFETDYRTRLVSAIESDLHAIERDLQAIRDRSAAVPGDKPALTEVEKPDPAATKEVDVRGFLDDPPASAPLVGSGGEQPGSNAIAEAASAGAAEMTGADGDDSERENAVDNTPRESQTAPASQPARAETGTIDLFGAEQAASESAALDDDSFFKSLRDAVRDDAPLDSRDASERAFFDQDSGDSPSLREAFKRRR